MYDLIVFDELLKDERVNRLGDGAELFYYHLLGAVDAAGRYYAEPILLRAALYPFEIDKIKDIDIRQWLNKCQVAGLIKVYPVNNRAYLELTAYNDKIASARSQFPAEKEEDRCQEVNYA